MLHLLLCILRVLADQPTTYAHFSFRNNTGVTDLGIYVRWLIVPQQGYIYPAFQFSFETGQVGYIGTQLVGTERKVLFAIWDAGSMRANTTTCVRFDGEGAGAHCLRTFPWEASKEYFLQVQRTSSGWEGSIQLKKKRTLIGTILLPPTRVRTESLVFHEYFNGSDTCNQPVSRIAWRGPYSGESMANQIDVPYYTQCPNSDVSLTTEPVGITSTCGGSTQRTLPPGTRLLLPY
jgi:hypothetical protein